MLVWRCQKSCTWSRVIEGPGAVCGLWFRLIFCGFSAAVWDVVCLFVSGFSWKLSSWWWWVCFFFGHVAVQWQLCCSQPGAPAVCSGFPWNRSGGRLGLPFCSVNREEIIQDVPLLWWAQIAFNFVNSGCYFVAHEVLILEFLSLTVFLKQQFLPLLVLLFLFWILYVFFLKSEIPDSYKSIMSW